MEFMKKYGGVIVPSDIIARSPGSESKLFKEDQAYCRRICLGSSRPLPPPSRQQVVSLSQSSCLSRLLTGGGGPNWGKAGVW